MKLENKREKFIRLAENRTNKVLKEIIGYNNYPKNYNSFKNYITNKI